MGGNHEAPGHLREMYFGGYASKGIFYLGHSGVFEVGGLRVVGVSGIYKSHDYDKPLFESPPYSEQTKRSAYHVRKFEIEKLMLIEGKVDIVVSHDWPNGITSYGDIETLLRLKDRTGQLRQEVQSNSLGNPHTMRLLKKLKPRYWFAGHMHAKFAAIYTHDDGSITRFLALDKCLPRRGFLQMLTSSSVESLPGSVFLDLEWLAILKLNNDMLPTNGPGRHPLVPPRDLDIQTVANSLRTHRVAEPKPNKFEFPYLGQTQPGNDQYRRWMCAVLGMTDRLGNNQIPAHVPAGAPTNSYETNTPIASVLSEDALFFEDSYA